MPDPMIILLVVVFAGFIFFQYRNSKRRQREAAERLVTIVPGAEVMTNFGLYGKLISMDEDDNTALLEVSDGTVVKLHRQVILKAVDPVDPIEDAVTADEAPDLNSSNATPNDEPEFGERTTVTKKPARKSATKPEGDSAGKGRSTAKDK